MITKKIPIDVSKGMFSDEFAGSLKTVDGSLSFFIAKSHVEVCNGVHLLPVQVLEENPVSVDTILLPLMALCFSGRLGRVQHGQLVG